jgi:hypothetical protein
MLLSLNILCDDAEAAAAAAEVAAAASYNTQ